MQINYSATFKIDDDGPKAKAFAPGPVINSNDAQGARISLTGRPLQVSDDRIIAHSHARAGQ